MRYVDRKSVPVPKSLRDKGSPAEKERILAIEHYAQQPPPKKAYKFKVYKAKDVQETLAQLFHNKCAYCESSYGATQPVDVEHYRPKGAVKGEAHAGYWWLASNWNNLLPSCIHCNREHHHQAVELAADGTAVVGSKKVLYGKKDRFPVAAAKRATGDDEANLAAEGALLIDPCRDRPDSHLAWQSFHTHLPTVAPVRRGGIEDERGRATIDILGLNRHGLVSERGYLILEIALEISRIRDDLLLAIAQPAGELRKQLLARVASRLEDLSRHEAPERRFSTAASAYISAAKETLLKEFEGELLPKTQGQL
ncbi:hypothetical protein [Variovorax sp. WS11]|uniref:hypothetical protein n=1 Tax=Variovorax sp. WS11 TaxID=1105204 RepID=UPI0011B1CA19|nr:hypothetical protein [Variovorax sp. WS11]NDZ15545.1 hypothetical protein [Variovorax sp. WS11]